MVLKGLITLEKPNHEVIADEVLINIDKKTHIAALASRIPINRLEGTKRMSIGFMLNNTPIFFPSIPCDCISISSNSQTLCFETDCDKLYERNLKNVSNNYIKLYTDIFLTTKGGKHYDNICEM